MGDYKERVTRLLGSPSIPISNAVISGMLMSDTHTVLKIIIQPHVNLRHLRHYSGT